MNNVSFNYTDFCTQEEIDTFKRVKRRTMKLADAARHVCAELTGATIGDGQRSDKQFLRSRRGQFRMALSTQSDNSTEVAAHARMGVQTIYMGERDSIMPWLRDHGVEIGWFKFFDLVRIELG